MAESNKGNVDKVKEQMANDLAELRKLIAELEVTEAERKQMGKELKKNEKRFRACVETLLDGFAIFSAVRDETAHIVDFRYEYINESGCKLNQRTCKEQIGHTILELLPRHKDTGLFDEYVRVVETGQPLVRESLFYEDIFGRNQKLKRAFDFRAVKFGDGFTVDWRDITERKIMEKELQDLLARESRSARGWQELFDASTDIVGLISPDFEILEINKAGYESMGKKREELIGKKCYEVVHGLDSPIDGCPCQESIRTKKAEVGEITQGGRHCIATASPILDKNGELKAFAHTIKDITKRKQAEEALITSEARYQDLYENAPDMYVSVDPNTTIILRCNQTIATNLGYTKREIVGRPIFDMYHPDCMDDVKRTFQNFVETGEVRNAELQLKRKDGTKIDVSSRASAVRDDQGNILYSRASLRDITERKQAEEELIQSEEKYRRIFELAPDGIVTVDRKGVITSCNTAFSKLSEFSSSEIVGKHFSKLPTLRIKDIPRYFNIFTSLLKGRSTKPFEITWVHKDGAERLAEIRVSLVKRKNKITGLQVIARDITERKRAEEREKKLQRELDMVSRLATIGEMAAGIAHEINNPLTGVVGYSGLLLQKDLPEGMRKEVHIIYEGAQRVANITDRMLTYARQYKAERTSTDINDILETTLAMRTYAMQLSNIKVITRFDPNLPETIADAGQLQQVFLNIILNAEAEMITAHKGGNLSVKTERIDHTIRVSFRDDGSGISKKNLDKIFDPFFTTKEVGQGAGLGLSVSYGIVTQHGGKIYARSKLGKGSIFTVELPLVTQAEQLKLGEAAPSEPKKVSGVRILIVDDEPIVQQFLTALLTEEGHKVEIAYNANAALIKMRSKGYSLVLLDIKLPGTNGIELYKCMQKVAKSLVERVIFITGDVMGKDTMAFLTRTKAPYITKPFNTEQLMENINRLLGKQA